MNLLKNKISPILLILFLGVLGFIIGVLTIALWQENWLISEEALGREFIYQIEELNIDKRALFFLTLGKRLRAFFLLFLLAFTSVNFFINIMFFFINGLYIGSLIELFTIRYGVQGTFLYLSLVLPQGILYILGFLCLGCWCLNLEKIQGNVLNKKVRKIHQGLRKGTLGYAFIFILIGILLESFINTNIFLIFI